MKRIVNGSVKSNGANRAYAVFLLYAVAVSLPAQVFTSLHSFDGTDGAEPTAGLLQATNGYLYGTTFGGGANSQGTVFRITPRGVLTSLYSFCAQTGCTDGEQPYPDLIQALNGDLYGTTQQGGANGFGSIFKITPSGTLTTLYSFCSQSGCMDGAFTRAPLTQAANGDLYGTTDSGGANGDVGVSAGTIFKITPSGVLTTLYNFCSQSGCTDGGDVFAGLVQAANGDFYGATYLGGAYDSCPFGGCGTIFKATPGGALTALHDFCSQSGCPDGEQPQTALIQATNGDVYGVTGNGGANGNYGTVFKVTPSGAFASLYSFCSQPGCTDGKYPAGLIQATDGLLYGTTAGGGANGGGTIFKITLSGTLTTLYNFCSQTGCADGQTPTPLVQDTNGTFYGTTGAGGVNGDGSVFSFSVGLGPFVKTLPTIGIVGEAVKILGTNLTGATSVTFDGVTAAFTVVSAAEVTTTVPTGAATGKVQVVTPRGTLSSSVAFEVAP
jgi:uncharacterized repeat protein (TIGR03803 family)